MNDEDGADPVFLALQKRVADARQALLDLVAEHPGRLWTARELVDTLRQSHGFHPTVVGIAIRDLVKRGSLKWTANRRIQGVQRAVAGHAVRTL